MKWFSWITWFFVLSLLLIWSSGYWLWSQAVRGQFTQQNIEVKQQLEITQNLLGNWQQSYRLNLGYLQKQLADWDPVSVNNPLLDPWQEVDDKLSHALWQDPLLAYAVLDSSGRVLRLSSNQAGNLFAQTQATPVAEYFLPPLVTADQWIIPILFRINNQSIMLWFDASALKQQIYQQLSVENSLTEFQLISQQGELWTQSLYRRTLLARLGNQSPTPIKLEKFFAKKPPEDLMLSRQRFDSSAAWSYTSVFLAMQKQSRGAAADYYPNYMGRPALAAWRWSDAWQAFIVIERDATHIVKQQKSWWRYGLMALVGLSLFLTLGFYLVQRRLQLTDEALFTDETSFADEQIPAAEASTVPTVALPELKTAATSSPEVLPEQTQAVLQSATLPVSVEIPSSVANDPAASAPIADYLVADYPASIEPVVAAAELVVDAGATLVKEMPRLQVESWPADGYRQSTQQRGSLSLALQPALTQLVQHIRQKLPQHEIGLEFSDALPLWVELVWPSVQRALQYLLLQACIRAERSEIIVRVMLAEQQLLRFEIIDGGTSLTEGQWLNLLHPDGTAKDDVIFRKIQRELNLMSAQLSGVSEPGGNKMIVSIPIMVLQHAEEGSQTELQLVDATALLLSPSGELQHLYRRLLRHTGLELMPLDDAEQFMNWCASQQQQKLDYLLLDELFVRNDVTLAQKLLQIVRRYFPQVQLLVITAQPAQWRELVAPLQLRLLLKPLVNKLLQQALVSTEPGVFAYKPQKVWLYQPESLQYWFQEQQLLALGYQVQRVSERKQISGLSAHDLVLIPSTLQADEDLNNCRALVLWTCQTFSELCAVQHGWLVGQGTSALSRQMFVLISSRQSVSSR